MSLLRDLDEKYVPRLAAFLARGSHRAGPPPPANRPATPASPASPAAPAARRAPGRPAAAARPRAATGAPAKSPLPVILRLRRLDDRWARGGPLALLREVPQLGAVLITALVLVSSIAVYSRNRPDAPGAATGVEAEEDPLADGTLGPDIGDSVDTYVRETIIRLGRLGTSKPDAMVVAVVQFKGYYPPEQVRDALGPLQVRQVFYRAPMKLPNGIVRTVPVEDLVVDGKRAFRAAAKERADEAEELAKVAATIENDPEQKTEHLKDAHLASREAQLLRGPCKCVFAVVVRAQLRLLLDSMRIPQIRVVDVSEPDAEIGDLTYSALLPEETTVVTGGNQA